MRKRTHQEILDERHSIEDMSSIKRFPLILILNNIRSMHNIGSIFRTADAACIQKIYLTGYTAQPPRDEINKTALGATETVPWEYVESIHDLIQTLKKNHIKIAALEQTTQSTDLYDFKSEETIALILGNEVFGIDDDVIERVDHAIEIPMHGMKHSLNVSVAAGVAVFEMIRTMRKL